MRTTSGNGSGTGLRRFLYLTCLFTGAAIMIIEILGARMLTPYFGTSHFVWTAQIAVTMAALAAGYYIGGWSADKNPSKIPGLLYSQLAITGAYLCLVVRLTEPIAFSLLRYSLPVASLITSFILYFIPLTLLACTGPLLIRWMTENINQVGGSSGRLFAWSTVGSLSGTLLLGYFLIPRLPHSIILYLTALILILLSLVYFFFWHIKRQGTINICLMLIIGTGVAWTPMKQELNPQYRDGTVLCQVNSHFGTLQVVHAKQTGWRFLLNDYVDMNDYDPQSQQGASLFTHIVEALAISHTPELKNVLFIGLGGGISSMKIAQHGAKVDVIEINEEMMPLAEKYFDFDPKKVNVIHGDGRWYLNQCQKKYDAVILDAGVAESAPSHLFTWESFSEIHKILNPSGVLVVNTLGWLDVGRNGFAASVELTLRRVFPDTKVYTSGEGNVFFVAGRETPLQVFHPPSFDNIPPWLRKHANFVFSAPTHTNPSHGWLLTDDFRPSEFRDAHNREMIRRELVKNMKSQVVR